MGYDRFIGETRVQKQCNDCIPVMQLPKIEENCDGLLYKYARIAQSLKSEVDQLKLLVNTKVNHK